jgi:ABC-type sugar transport system permease subunit
LAAEQKVKTSMKRGRIGQKAYIFFISPAIVYLLVFTIYPSVFGVGLSFTNYHFAYTASNFTGIANYIQFLRWPDLPQVMINTLVFVSVVVFFQITLGLLIALVLNQPLWGRKAMRTVSILPWVLPGFIIGLLFRQIFSSSKYGLLNMIIEAFGMEPQKWLADPKTAMILLIVSLIWKGTALSVILELSGLQTIPQEFTDAAKIDGASGIQRFFRITIPMLRNTLLINLIMASSGTFNHLDIPFTLTEGGPGHSTEVLALTMYKQGFQVLNASFAATIGSVILIINIVLTIVYLKILQNDDAG